MLTDVKEGGLLLVRLLLGVQCASLQLSLQHKDLDIDLIFTFDCTVVDSPPRLSDGWWLTLIYITLCECPL